MNKLRIFQVLKVGVREIDARLLGIDRRCTFFDKSILQTCCNKVGLGCT